MIKICVVGPSKKYFSGVSIHTIFLANSFLPDSKVSALLIRNLLPRFLYPGNKHVGREDYSIELDPDISIYEGMDWNSPLSWFRAYRFLKREKPDIIIMAWWTSAVAHMELFLALVNSISIRAKLVLEMHEIVDPLEAGKFALLLYSRVMGKLIMNRTAAFVVHSEKVKNRAIEAYHLNKDKVFSIPIGIYDSYFQNYPKESARNDLAIKEKFVILNFGMIRKYKGVPCLVEAFNQLPSEMALNSRLVIAGENWGDEEGIDALIKASPYYSQITFQPEFVADTMVPKYFSAADVVVLPYLRSAGSAVASLAMAYGKPIIITDLENIRETLQAYNGTIFVPCGDATSITEKLLGVYAHYMEGRIATYASPSSLGWDKVADSFHKIIKQVNNNKM